VIDADRQACAWHPGALACDAHDFEQPPARGDLATGARTAYPAS
jgi:hypothetical protein